MGSITHRSARDQAQELAWEAMDVIYSDPERAAALCREALSKHAECADALSILAQLECEREGEYIDALRHAVEAGRRDLGPRCFKEEKSLFWGLHETRPFMRAMALLADVLLQWGVPEAVDEAIRIHEEMLELNPNDNQGVRDCLAGSYLARKRYDDARVLFARYPDDWLAAPAWARVLLAYATDGEDQASELLEEARARNAHVEAYLSGRKRRPRTRAGMYSPGDESEAVFCADILWAAWKAHPQARKWLKAATSDPANGADVRQSPRRTDDREPDTVSPKLYSLAQAAEAELAELMEIVEPGHRARFLAIVEHIDTYCMNHLEPLHKEYAAYAREMAAELCCDGSPVVNARSAAEGWAAGIVGALGFVNFLSDPSFPPVKTMAEVAAAFGISESGLHDKSRRIRKRLDLMQFEPAWTLPSLMDRNPFIWMLETPSGMLVDIRTRPREEQVAAFEAGLIPYVPADQSEPAATATDASSDLPLIEPKPGQVPSVIGRIGPRD